MIELLNLSKELFERWNAEQVQYCHWKSNEHLIDGLNGDTDLDILVDLHDKINAENTLLLCKYKKFFPQYGSKYQDVDEWIGFDSLSGRLIHVHLHYRMITGHKGLKEYELPWAELALNTRVLDPQTSVYIMKPDLELITLYTRIGLKASIRQVHQAKKGTFELAQDIKKEIEYLKKRIDWKSVESHLKSIYGKSAEQFYQIIKLSEIDSKTFLQLINITTDNGREYRKHGKIISTVQKYYYAVVLKSISYAKNVRKLNIITRKIRSSKKGLLVAFIGQDGSGKSTVTDEIEKWLTWKIEAKKFYLGSGEQYHSWRKRLHNHLSVNKNIIISCLCAWLTVSDYVALSRSAFRTIKKAQKYTGKGGIAIFDRYPQIEYEGINDGPKIRSNYLPRVTNSLIKAYIVYCANREEKYLNAAVQITPEIIFKLILPPEVSIQRKPEEDYNIIIKKHEIIKNLKFNDSEVYIIDAAECYESEIIKIKGLIWQQIQSL